MSHSVDSPSSGSPGAHGSVVPLVDNAFLVLGLTPRASWPRIKQAAEALIAALEAGDPSATRYDTPLGPQPRSEAAVFRALTRLRDPDERIQHELWWEAPTRGAAPRRHQHDAWPEAPAAWGWRAR